MIHKRKILVSLLAALMFGLLAFPNGTALAACNRTGGSGSNDTVVCSNPPDTDGISTGSGDDRITINADTTVSGGSTTVDSGSDSDYVENRGTITATTDAINARDGANDTVINYGTITAGDDGIWCSPRTGQTCTIRNYGSVTSVNETLDFSNSNGTIIVFNQGTLKGNQETMHFHGYGIDQIENRNYIESKRSGIEVYLGTAKITNSGTIYSTGSGQMAILLYTNPDTIYNAGTLKSARYTAIYMHGGADVLQNTGSIEARSSSTSMAAVMMGPGNDTMVTSGSVLETGTGYAAIAMNDGNDTLTIRGGKIQGKIYGNGGSDKLIFELTGSSSEVAAFRNRVNSQSPSSGSATWRGNIYDWRQFETIQMNLTVGASPNGTVIVGMFDLPSWFTYWMFGA